MELIIDRIESDIAVCENIDRTMVDIPLFLLPEGVKAGDVISKNELGEYVIDSDKTLERKQRIKRLLNNLWE
ncbi:MAG: DUF3006 domain-containing protein [Oscillospiraceae bacterium]|nr:DUF3006 domain-containing protein [Oscillospiraceae bacterium]